jgi:uncharacterized protein (DUF1800 family)
LRNPSPWSPYVPSRSAPWNLARAWTLRRRAGFAATWPELERDLAGSPGAAVDRVLSGQCRTIGVPAEFNSTAALLGDAATGSSDPRRLEAWWLYRALFTPDPLGERLTLAWHDHFATSQVKVDDVAAMRAQNDTFRQLGRGPFGDLLRAMLHDPALLIWLDASTNRKGKPNENLARELIELFTLGVGRFTESDVKECARALTGLTVGQGHFLVKTSDHDDDNKTIVGKTARFDAEQLADHLLAQPATADRLAWRLCTTFLGEGVADESERAALAELLRRNGLHIGRAVETILRSTLFFSDKNLHTCVADPVGFVIGSVRALELFSPPPSTLLLAEWTARLGQELFFPPNVGGWPGGRRWLSGRGIVARANFAAALGLGRLGVEARPPDLSALAATRGRSKHAPESLSFLGELLGGRRLDPALARSLWQSAAGTGSDSEQFNRAVAALLSRPESQLT